MVRTAPATLGEEARIGEIHGPVEAFFMRLSREITASDGSRAGTRSPAPTRSSSCSLAVAVVTAVGSLSPAIEQPCREILRLVTLAMLGIVIVKLVNTPDSIGLVERRQGAWIALGVTGIMASSAATLYAAKLTRRKVGPSLNEYQPHLVAPPRSTAFERAPHDRY